MNIPAQSTATTKTYTVKVKFSDGWIDSNEFTVTWTNSAHTITVTGGTANPSSATVGTEITLTPSAAPSGLVFDKWEVVSGGVTVTDNKFTMPDTNVEIKTTYKVSIENQEVPVGTEVFIPWPEGATTYQRFEGSTFDESGDRSGYPTGMYIPAQSTAATKTYKFSVQFSDGWIDSNEFTVTWKNATTYSATVADINISLPAGYGSSAIDALGEQRAIKITNTGTETLNIAVPTLSGTNADAFSIQSFGSSIVTAGSTNSNAYAVRPKTELEPGTYTATISCTDAAGRLAVPVTATVTLTVGEHHFDTSTWVNNETHHWNPCTDTGCTAHGNEALHNSDTVKNAEAATFDTDGYTGDKHCSVCDRKMETGTAIAAGKYIRESKATMTPASITADQCANDLVFASLETSKYTVALHSVYDMTDTSLNTASGKYPTATKFVAGHQYRIVFKFTAVSPYAYDETHSTHCSTFTLNGAATNLAPFTSLAGSPNRMIELTAGASGITTYTVTINAGANMTLASGSANQSGLSGAMTDTVYTAADGYYFPTDYAVEAVNGISVTRNSYTQITVSGTPTANTAITLTQATAKTKEATPSAAFTADSENGGKLTGVDNTMKYSVNGGSNWLDIAGDNMAITSVTTANGVQVKKPATDANTKLDSDIQSIDVTKSATPTGVTGAACTTSANNDGKLQNVTNLMEYKKSDAGSWTDCGGTEVTGLANGTYYVRVKASGTALASDNQTVTVAAYAAPSHTHSWATAWSNDETYHWHNCTAEGCDVTENSGKDGYGTHDYTDDTDTTCNTCDYERTVAHEHTFGAWSDEVPATCKTTGTKGHKDCTGCNKHFDADGNEITDLTIPVDPANHEGTLGDWVKTDPDKHWKEYSCCHVKDEEATHTASDWITDTAATATTDGTKHKECTVCHRVLETGTIPATGYTITFDANGGSVTPANAVTGAGGKLTSLPTPTRSGSYSFDDWYTAASGGTKVTTSYQFTADTTVYAHWTYTGGGGGWYYTYYTIKATAGTNGSISPSGWTSVRDGRDQTFTITPDKGYAVAKVLVDGKSVGAVKSYTFKNVTKDHTIEAIFMKSNGNPQTGVFVDVAEGSYYEEAIDWAVEKGITNGVSSNMFAPNDPCTRAQIVTFLWRAAGSPAPKSMSSFTDVPADAFYAKAVAWAVENGITSGTGEGKFSPNSTCTRAQAVTFLYRASGSPAVSGKAEFSDVSSTAFYAEAVAWAAKKGITTGIGGGLFGSDNDCTRGQIVTFLWRAMAE